MMQYTNTQGSSQGNARLSHNLLSTKTLSSTLAQNRSKQSLIMVSNRQSGNYSSGYGGGGGLEVPPILQQIAQATALNYTSASTRNEISGMSRSLSGYGAPKQTSYKTIQSPAGTIIDSKTPRSRVGSSGDSRKQYNTQPQQTSLKGKQIGGTKRSQDRRSDSGPGSDNKPARQTSNGKKGVSYLPHQAFPRYQMVSPRPILTSDSSATTFAGQENKKHEIPSPQFRMERISESPPKQQTTFEIREPSVNRGGHRSTQTVFDGSLKTSHLMEMIVSPKLTTSRDGSNGHGTAHVKSTSLGSKQSAFQYLLSGASNKPQQMDLPHVTTNGCLIPSKADLLDSAAAALLRSSSITHLDKQASLTSLLKLTQQSSPSHRRRPSYEDPPNTQQRGHQRKKSKAYEKELKAWRDRVEELEEALKRADQARNELQRTLEDTAAKQLESQAKMSKYSEIVAQENHSLTQQVSVLTELLSQRDDQQAAVQAAVTQKTALLASQSADLLVLDSLKVALDQEKRLKGQLNTELEDSRDLQARNEESYKEHISTLQTSLSDSLDELSQANRKIQLLESETTQLSTDCQHLLKKLEIQQRSNHAYEEELVRLQADRERFSQNMTSVRHEFEKVAHESKQENESLRSILQESRQQTNRMQQEKQDKDHLLKELTCKNLELLAKIATMETACLPLKEGMQSQINELESRALMSEQYCKGLGEAQDQVKACEARAEEAERLYRSVQAQMDGKDQELERLSILVTASDQLIYHPLYQDLVDRKLGEYINSSPLKMRIHLMRLEREGDGVYRFGSKRALIKLENECIIIRVGGGFMNIDEFVDQYCNPMYPETPLGNNINTGNVPSPSKGGNTQKKRQATLPASLPLTSAHKLTDLSRIQQMKQKQQQQQLAQQSSGKKQALFHAQLRKENQQHHHLGILPAGSVEDSLQFSVELAEGVNIDPFKYD